MRDDHRLGVAGAASENAPEDPLRGSRDKRSFERFPPRLEDASPCLLVDQTGAGYEAELRNISLGGVCVRLLRGGEDGRPVASGPHLGQILRFTRGGTSSIGQHLEGRQATITWKDGLVLGLAFERTANGPGDGTGLLRRLRAALSADGRAAVPVLKRVKADMGRLLGKGGK